MFGQLFDERFKAAAGGINAYAPVRMTLCVCVATFVGLGVGWMPALVWSAAAMLSEAIMLAATRYVARTERLSRGAAWVCAAVYMLAVPTWSLAGVILWAAPTPACHIAGAAFFAGHLLYIQAHHAHSPGAALPVLPSVLLPAIVPLAIPQFQGVDQAIVCLAMAAVVLHANISLWVSLKKSQALQDAQQAMAAASRAKSEFLARMSHEIRTPLNGVLGMAQALAVEIDLKPAHRQSLGVIRQSGESLLAILNDILDLSKVEAGKLELETIPFDLEATVRGAQATFAPQAVGKGLAFRLDLAPEATGLYHGDPTRVRQILYNLLSNAVKFTATGDVGLSVRRRGEALELEVWDTGIGVAAADLDRLFGRFQQVDSSTTRRFGGTGLGLSICRELAELMGGSVDVASVVGEGTRFTVRLPLPRLGDAPTETGLGPDTLEAGLAETGVALRILAAEDNPINQLVLRTLLAQAGLEPTIVDHGQAAVEAWRTGGYDVILMDVQMPVMDGVTAAREIRAIEARDGLTRTPIVALTANAMQHQVAEYAAAGFDSHVAKPIDAARLYEAIADAADRLSTVDSAAA